MSDSTTPQQDNASTTSTTNDRAADPERTYTIDKITFQYSYAWGLYTAGLGEAPSIDAYVLKYPEFAADLLEFALYFHTFGFHTMDLSGPADATLSPAAEKALARIHAMNVDARKEGGN